METFHCDLFSGQFQNEEDMIKEKENFADSWETDREEEKALVEKPFSQPESFSSSYFSLGYVYKCRQRG